MATSPHSARVTGPVAYTTSAGQKLQIPLGPCLVEQLDERLVDIIWGAQGDKSAELAVEDVKTAERQGHLILLD